MKMAKIKIDRELYVMMKEASRQKGYSSVDELAAHLLEEQIRRIFDEQEDPDVTDRLRGLGYIS